MEMLSSSTVSALRARIRAMAAHAAELVIGAAYVNYMIIDPTQADSDGILPGVPFYVGQTADIAKRISWHMKCALAEGSAPGSVYERIAGVVMAGAMPIFRVLEIHSTRADCLLAETVWAQRLLRGGVQLCNQCPSRRRSCRNTK